MDRRAKRPLNAGAACAADEDIYTRHAGDARPNPLYDEFGNPKPLDPKDKSQSTLRKERTTANQSVRGLQSLKQMPPREILWLNRSIMQMQRDTWA